MNISFLLARTQAQIIVGGQCQCCVLYQMLSCCDNEDY